MDLKNTYNKYDIYIHCTTNKNTKVKMVTQTKIYLPLFPRQERFQGDFGYIVT